jgi:uncharacterized protein (TIGR00369 family)
MTPLETIAAHPMPLAQHLGVEFLEASPVQVTAWMTVREEHCTVGRAVHGGVVMAFGDSLGAALALLNLAAGAGGTVTLESKTNFVGRARPGEHLVGLSELLHRGARTQVAQTRIETGDGRAVAFVTQTQMTLGAPTCGDDLTANRRAEALA